MATQKKNGPTLTISPSKLERAVLCPASPRLNAGIPWKDTPASARGRALHDAMALLFQAGPDAWEKVKKAVPTNPNCKPEDLEQVAEAYRIGTGLHPDDGDTKVLVESQLQLGKLGLSETDEDGNKRGLVDLIYISPKYKQAVVIDWKFGASAVSDPDSNWQMKAYAVGMMLTFPEHDLQAVEAVIIQPAAFKPDDRVRSVVWSRDQLRKFALDIQGAVHAAQQPDATAIPNLAAQCRFCGAKDKCVEYAHATKAKAVHQEAQQQAAVAEITTAGTPVLVEPAQPLSFPIVVINAETVAKAQALRERILSMAVTDKASADALGQACREARALDNLIEKNREAVKKPVLDLGREIDAQAKKATMPLREAAAHGDAQVGAWVRAQEEAARKQREEQERREREAREAAAKAAAEEQRKANEAAAAARAAQEAAERAENFKTKAARDKALAEAQAQAAAAAKLQAESEAKARERAAAEEQERQAQAAQVSVAPEKVPGYRATTETTWEIPDFAAIPKELLAVILTPNTKVIESMIKTGTITEAKHGAWIKITRAAGVARTR